MTNEPYKQSARKINLFTQSIYLYIYIYMLIKKKELVKLVKLVKSYPAIKIQINYGQEPIIAQ